MFDYRFSGEATDYNAYPSSTVTANLKANLYRQLLEVSYAIATFQSGSVYYSVNIGVISNLDTVEVTRKVNLAIAQTFGGVSNVILDSVRPIGTVAGINVNQNPNTPVNSTNNSNSAANANNQVPYYVVKAGDTLAKIARQFNTTVSELARLNNIANVNLISVGQVIRVRANAANTSTPTNTNTNTTTKPVITGASNGTITTTTTEVPKPNHKGFWSSLSESLGVAPYVIGISAVAIGLILLVPRDNKN